jgi:dolichol kinase
MPTNKHKRKTAAHTKPKAAKYALSSRLLTLHPKAFISLGLFFVTLGLHLLAFEAKNNAMFGVAMLSLIAGTATTIYAKFAMPKKKQTK